MIEIITAINNPEIFKELKNKKEIKILCEDIQYKEGILEILEKNKKINYIIFYENLYGEIKIEELIKKIKNTNNKINIIVILNKKDLIKQEYLIKNKIKFIFKEELSVEKIFEIIFNKNKVIGIIGNEGSGKTVTAILLSEIILKYKNKKVLLIEDNIKNNSILNLYKIKNKQKNDYKNNIIEIKKNLYLFSIKNILLNNKKDINKIIYEINKIKNNFDFIFIDFQNLNSYKIYNKIIEKNILILNPNILEINKVKKYILNNKIKIKCDIILNNYNENSISEKIIKNIFNNKIKIIGKIENNKNYNLIINNNFNMKYLDKKTYNKFLNIIKRI